MKKMINDVTKRDIPLNYSMPLNRNTSPSQLQKNKINVISRHTPVPISQKTRDELKQKLAYSSSSVSMSALEKINEENVKNYKFRERRNRVVIIVLIVLLLLALSWITVYTSILMSKSNCFLYSSGDSNVTFYVDGETKTKFRAPANLQGDRLYIFDLSITLDNAGEYNVDFAVFLFIGNEKLTTRVAYEPNLELFKQGENGWYHSTGTITAFRKINLCQGVILDEIYKDKMSYDNFRLEVHTNITKV